jgi:hypothetical protein
MLSILTLLAAATPGGDVDPAVAAAWAKQPDRAVAAAWATAGRPAATSPAQPKKPAPKKAAPEIAWLTDYDAAVAERDRTKKPVFILFTEPDTCIYCKKLEAGPLKDPAVIAELGKYVCLKVDLRTDAGLELEKKFSRQLRPALLVYRDGTVAGEWSGETTTDNLKALLRILPPPPPPQPQQQSSAHPPGYHTHTCVNGHTWGHTGRPGDDDHHCPICRQSQYVIDPPGRAVTPVQAHQTFQPMPTYRLGGTP